MPYIALQPDQGTVCAYWIACLIAAIGSSARDCSMEFQWAALLNLLAAVYLYTGEVVPRRLRTRLVDAFHSYQREAGAPGLESESVAEHHLNNRITGAAALSYVLRGDAAFASQQRRIEDFLRRGTNPSAQVMESLAQATFFACSRTESRLHTNHESTAEVPTAAMLLVHMYLRGGGLVASAFGMLHCREAVCKLCTRWVNSQARPMRTTADVLYVVLSANRDDENVQSCVASREAMRAAEAQFGRNNDLTRHLFCANTSLGHQRLERGLRSLQPHHPGGSSAAFVQPIVVAAKPRVA